MWTPFKLQAAKSCMQPCWMLRGGICMTYSSTGQRKTTMVILPFLLVGNPNVHCRTCGLFKHGLTNLQTWMVLTFKMLRNKERNSLKHFSNIRGPWCNCVLVAKSWFWEKPYRFFSAICRSSHSICGCWQRSPPNTQKEATHVRNPLVSLLFALLSTACWFLTSSKQ